MITEGHCNLFANYLRYNLWGQWHVSLLYFRVERGNEKDNSATKLLGKDVFSLTLLKCVKLNIFQVFKQVRPSFPQPWQPSPFAIQVETSATQLISFRPIPSTPELLHPVINFYH